MGGSIYQLIPPEVMFDPSNRGDLTGYTGLDKKPILWEDRLKYASDMYMTHIESTEGPNIHFSSPTADKRIGRAAKKFLDSVPSIAAPDSDNQIQGKPVVEDPGRAGPVGQTPVSGSKKVATPYKTVLNTDVVSQGAQARKRRVVTNNRLVSGLDNPNDKMGGNNSGGSRTLLGE